MGRRRMTTRVMERRAMMRVMDTRARTTTTMTIKKTTTTMTTTTMTMNKLDWFPLYACNTYTGLCGAVGGSYAAEYHCESHSCHSQEGSELGREVRLCHDRLGLRVSKDLWKGTACWDSSRRRMCWEGV